MAPKNYVLTGLSFKTIQVDSAYSTRLRLQAYSALLDYYSGQVIVKHQKILHTHTYLPINSK